MRVEAVELRRLRLPLVEPFRTSYGEETERDVLLVHVVGDVGEGWGECAAPSTPGYTAEHVDGAHAVVRDELVPRLWSTAVTVAGLDAVLGPEPAHPMARAAVEMAVLDAGLRAAGESLAHHLGGVRDAVDAGIAIGIVRDLDALVGRVAAAVDVGYRRVKLKIEPGWDVQPVRAVREELPDLALQVDANGAYALADAAALEAIDPFDLLLVEQPLPADDLAGHAELAGRLRTRVCLDESVTSARVAERAIGMGACSVVNVKAPRVGGLAEARRVHDVCVAAGVPVWCGGMLDTGIGRAANVALASLPGFTLPGDLSASDRWFRRDVTAPWVLDEGRLRVPAGPGLGVSPDAAALDELTTASEWLRAP